MTRHVDPRSRHVSSPGRPEVLPDIQDLKRVTEGPVEVTERDRARAVHSRDLRWAQTIVDR